MMRQNTDAAALAAAIIASTFTIVDKPGPYDVIDLVVGISVALILIGYAYSAGGHTIPQRLALAGASGLVAIPIMGAVLDLTNRCYWVDHDGNLTDKIAPCLTDDLAAWVWGAAGFVAFLLSMVVSYRSALSSHSG